MSRGSASWTRGPARRFSRRWKAPNVWDCPFAPRSCDRLPMMRRGLCVRLHGGWWRLGRGASFIDQNGAGRWNSSTVDFGACTAASCAMGPCGNGAMCPSDGLFNHAFLSVNGIVAATARAAGRPRPLARPAVAPATPAWTAEAARRHVDTSWPPGSEMVKPQIARVRRRGARRARQGGPGDVLRGARPPGAQHLLPGDGAPPLLLLLQPGLPGRAGRRPPLRRLRQHLPRAALLPQRGRPARDWRPVRPDGAW